VGAAKIVLRDNGSTTGKITLASPISLTPDPADATSSALDPTILLSLTPDQADATSSALDPTVSLGTLEVTPGPADATVDALDAMLSLALSLTPDSADATATALDPTLSVSVSVTPDPADATCEALDPSIAPIALAEFSLDLELEAIELELEFEDIELDLTIDEIVDFSLSLDEPTTDMEILVMGYVAKAGSLIPGIAGTITVPFGINLTDCDFRLRYEGTTSPAREVEAENDGLAEDSPALDNEEGLPTKWAWHYDWEAGDTNLADDYVAEIHTEVAGKAMIVPNDDPEPFILRQPIVLDDEED
jgi:hypothetical protein